MVGIGFGQAVHVPAFRDDPRCVVVAIAASDGTRAARIAERLRIPAAYGDWRELVRSRDVDVVSVAVPPELQPEVVAAAATAGKAVLCEKPLATDVRAADAMLAAARAAGIVSAVDLEFAELPAWREVTRLVQAGSLGSIRSCDLRWHVRTRPRPDVSWKERTEAGGGALGGFASHLLYLVEWCLGPVARIGAWLGPQRGRSRVEAWLDLASGCRCSLSVATDASVPSGLRAHVEGSEATLMLKSAPDDYVRGQTLAVGRLREPLVAVPLPDLPVDHDDPRVAAVAPLVRRFVDAVRSGTRMRPDLIDGVRVQLLLDALVAADRHGSWIET